MKVWEYGSMGVWECENHSLKYTLLEAREIPGPLLLYVVNERWMSVISYFSHFSIVPNSPH